MNTPLEFPDLMPGLLCVIPSTSNPDVGYEITVGKQGDIYCSCPSWKFSKDRSCKHLKQFFSEHPAIYAAMIRGQQKLDWNGPLESTVVLTPEKE